MENLKSCPKSTWFNYRSLTKVPTATRDLNLASLSVSLSRIYRDRCIKDHTLPQYVEELSTNICKILLKIRIWNLRLQGLIDIESLLQNHDASVKEQNNYKRYKKYNSKQIPSNCPFESVLFGTKSTRVFWKEVSLKNTQLPCILLYTTLKTFENSRTS